MSVIGCTENSHLPDECARCAARPGASLEAQLYRAGARPTNPPCVTVVRARPCVCESHRAYTYTHMQLSLALMMASFSFGKFKVESC